MFAIFRKIKYLLIEVKGINLMKLDKDTIFIKQKAVKDAGYICEIWVYNSKGEKVECHA